MDRMLLQQLIEAEFAIASKNAGGAAFGWLLRQRAPAEGSLSSVWAAAGSLEHVSVGTVDFRCAARQDAGALLKFVREELTDRSRALFAPYPYELSDAELLSSFHKAIEDSLEGQSLSFIFTEGSGGKGAAAVEEEPRIVAHAFLWAAQTQVPEVGIAVADRLQGRGLGKAVMAILVGCARCMHKDALELTTMLDNTRAKTLYEKTGFETLGTIINPLGCDVTAAFEGRAEPTGIAEEYQMVLFLRQNKALCVRGEMAAKRHRSHTLFQHISNTLATQKQNVNGRTQV
jgi:GNAT superfamily N-acetyltransferase